MKIQFSIILLILLSSYIGHSLFIQDHESHLSIVAHKPKKQFHLTIAQEHDQSHQHHAYTGLSVDEPLPSTYVQTEYYTITGKLNSPSSQKSTDVNLIIQDKVTKKRTDFSTTVLKNKKSFSLLVKMPQPGKYIFFLFAGSSGSSSGVTYQIKPFSEQKLKSGLSSGSNLKPSSLSLSIDNNKLFVNWNSVNCPIAKVRFEQNQNLTFYLSNSKNYFQVPFSQFWNFKPQQVKVAVSCANSSSRSLSGRNSQYSGQNQLTFLAGYHHFAEEIDSTEINVSNIPSKISLNQYIVVSGKVLTNCRNKIYLEIPSNGFQYFYLDSTKGSDYKVPAYSRFNVNLNKFTESGSFILQINDFNGEAVVNQPIYVGQAYPLIPDYRDLEPAFDSQKIMDETPNSISGKRSLLLALINSKRKEWGLNQLYLDDQLNTLAQKYAEDMMNRKFFGHYTPEGKGPQDRASAMGIQDSIGQNVAYNSNLTSGHYALCRSAGHLSNIVEKDWTRVGLGIAYSTSQQTFYIAEEFSTRDLKKFPLTNTQTSNINKQLTQAISNSCPSLLYSAFLTDVLSKQLKKPKSEQFSKSFGKSIISQGYSYSYFWLSGSYSSDFVQNNINAKRLSKNCKSYKKFGVVQQISNGSITITILFVA